MECFKMCIYNPKEHYNLESGTLQIGDFADFIEIDSLEEFNILKTYIKVEVGL